jgi:2-C-methyl-D-erythritol 2,4-cyclodiphosphate synthase
MAVPGDAANIKLTVPEDVALARRIAAGAGRVASGFDSHPFGPLDGLRLGAIEIADAPRLHGHSDGDVVLHALCDALLAAAGLGDLGRLFPASDPVASGVESRTLLVAVIERLAGAGLRPMAADITILAGRPRLGAARLEAMRHRLAGELGLHPSAVSVKAASGNLSGAEGAGNAISASCLVTVGPT